MTPKELEKLVKTCRKMGIKSYKGPDFEFTLTDDAPVKSSKSAILKEKLNVQGDVESDSLTQDQLLMWSAMGGGVPFSGEQEGDVT